MKKKLFKEKHKTKLEFFLDGEEYDKYYLNQIRGARESIYLHVYIFCMDVFGVKVFEELLAARMRGVGVFILVDAVGSSEFDEESIEQLRSAGAYFEKFNGVKFERLYKWGRRLHHKILLTDQKTALVGGINIISPYVDSGFSSPQLDFAVSMEGPITEDIKKYCDELFSDNLGKLDYPKTIKPLIQKVGHLAQVSVNDWMRRRMQISKNYVNIVNDAKSHITIINPYFFPRRKFMRRLVKAARRGVTVRLILAKYSDWPSWILASEYLYNYFLKNNVEIYLWDKSFLHGKLATVDGQWSTIGSFNLNYTSYQGNLEMNINIYSQEFTQEIDEKINSLITEGCVKVDPLEFNSIFALPKRFFFYILLAVISNFSLAFVFQEEEGSDSKGKFKAALQMILAIVSLLFGILGLFIPGIVGFPFVFLGVLIISRQILLNKGKEV